MKIQWNFSDLKKILEERIKFSFLTNEEECSENVFNQVFPETVSTTDTMKWLSDRTLGRPRELLQLARMYTEALPSDFPDVEVLKEIEEEYSKWKLDDLCAEFSNQYPDLKMLFDFWKTHYDREKYHFEWEEFSEKLFNILANAKCNSDWFQQLKSNIDIDGLSNILFEIGFIGDFIIGGDGGSRTIYSTEVHTPKFEQLQIHPCFRKAVGTVQRIRRR